MVRLRGHHLVCLHFFSGEGLGEEFRENYRQVLACLTRGEGLERAVGPDDVCSACPRLDGTVCGWDETAIRELDRLALAQIGEKTTWPELAERVRSFPLLWWEEFCEGCDWARYCVRPR